MQTLHKTPLSNSMTAPLQQVLVCSPASAGWGNSETFAAWRELGFLHAPQLPVANAQHQELCRQLQASGAELCWLPATPDLTLDAVYTHDSSFLTAWGAILMNPGKPNRQAEPARHRDIYQQLGLPVLDQILPPATTEAGDMVWLDSRTLLVGRGYRTNAAGIEQMRSILRPHDVHVISAPLPHGAGPGTCLHLMSLMSLLDERHILVDLHYLAVETVELLRERGFELIEIDPRERDTLACNVLALGEARLLAIAENEKTNRKLQQAGFNVRTFPGYELCVNGGGGPTCLTRPLLRA
ncbi:MAG: hypothetical protein H0X25_02735 [Acidobacteriales bacterium]|nr:hypothetical protein [Terriglobales bacterium]